LEKFDLTLSGLDGRGPRGKAGERRGTQKNHRKCAEENGKSKYF